MKGGGSIKGLLEIFSEIDIEVVGVGVAISNVEPHQKKVKDYCPIVYLGKVDEVDKKIEVISNCQIF